MPAIIDYLVLVSSGARLIVSSIKYTARYFSISPCLSYSPIHISNCQSFNTLLASRSDRTLANPFLSSLVNLNSTNACALVAATIFTHPCDSIACSSVSNCWCLLVRAKVRLWLVKCRVCLPERTWVWKFTCASARRLHAHACIMLTNCLGARKIKTWALLPNSICRSCQWTLSTSTLMTGGPSLVSYFSVSIEYRALCEFWM